MDWAWSHPLLRKRGHIDADQILAEVFAPGRDKKRIGAGDAWPVKAESFEFSLSPVNVVNPQPV